MRHVVGKPTICLCENKDADQLRGNREADQRLCFIYWDSSISLLTKYKISSLKPSPVAVQPGLCQTWSESTLLVFSHCGSNKPCCKKTSFWNWRLKQGCTATEDNFWLETSDLVSRGTALSMKWNQRYWSAGFFTMQLICAFVFVYAKSRLSYDVAQIPFTVLCFQLSGEKTELALFVNLNLAIVYLRTNRQPELMGLLHMIDPEKIETRYGRGLSSFTHHFILSWFLRLQYFSHYLTYKVCHYICPLH